MASRVCRAFTNTLWKLSFKNNPQILIPSQQRSRELIFNSRYGFHTTNFLEGVTEVKMPSLSPTMTEGTIVKWEKKEGDAVAAGDVLCEIQTDKAVVALEFDDDGILAKIIMPENSADIKVGSLIALVVGEGEDWQGVEVPKSAGTTNVTESPASKKQEQSSSSPTQSATKATSHSSKEEKTPLGPAVKSLLTQYGISSNQVTGSGPKGLVLKGDVLRYISGKNLKPVQQEVKLPEPKASKTSKRTSKETSAAYQDIEVTNMRRTIAKRLLQSKSTIPHAYGNAQCSIDKLQRIRKELQALGVKVSVNDFVIKIVANALSKCPAVNVVWNGSELVQKGSVDISVAVATDNGLITPIITNVGERDVIQISEQVKHLAEKARSGKLQPHEFMGGSFSISNLGMFGIHHFSAIINPPQCAILAVGGGHPTIDKNGKLVTNVGFTLSYDASAIEEEIALKFLAHLKHEVENVSEISVGIYNLQSRLEMLEISSST